jgi:carboxylesterase
MIQKAEFHLKGEPRDGVRRGVLLIHGLTGTPAEMLLLGKRLHSAGFTVHAVQLAGHCGDEADLLATGWRDWYASVERAAIELRAQVDHLFVAGLSMGALLALLLAARRPELVDGVGVLGATFRYDGWNMPAIARLSFLLPLVKRLGLAMSASAARSVARCWAVTAPPRGCPEIPGIRWPICTCFRDACVVACPMSMHLA